MPRTATLIGVWTLIASWAGGCTGLGPKPADYQPVLLSEAADPLVQEKNFTPWRPPRQMAAFVQPHEDQVQGVMIAGHWIMVLLGEGSWYFAPEVEREPLPDAEATAEDVRKALGAVIVPQGAVVPYRAKDGAKP